MQVSPAPHWSEGMFLTPQHMQAWGRHIAGHVAENRLTRPHSWGVSDIVIDEAALESSVFRLTRLSAILKDGTRIRAPEEVEIPSRDLSPLFEGRTSIDVLLAVPDYRPGRANVLLEGDLEDTPRRYGVRVDSDIYDENTGKNPRQLEYRSLRARILVTGENTDGFSTLRVARLHKTGVGDVRIQIDPKDVPAVTRVGAYQPLVRHIEELTDLLAGNARSLGDNVAGATLTFAGDTSGGQIELVWKLFVVNSSLTVFRAIQAIPDMHPLDVYLHMCRLVGELALFSSQRTPPDIGPYVHEAPAQGFNTVVELAKKMLKGVVMTAFEHREFKPTREGRGVQLDDSWIVHGKDLYIGVDSKADPDAVRRRIGVLKLTAPTDVERVQRDLLAGIFMNLETHVPVKLPRKDTRQFWKIEKDGPFWENAKREKGLVLFGRGVDDAALKMTLYVVSEE